MSKHEEKICDRCKTGFECKPGDVINCQCYGITLSADAETYIQLRYNDCLCRNCLLQIQQTDINLLSKKDSQL